MSSLCSYWSVDPLPSISEETWNSARLPAEQSKRARGGSRGEQESARTAAKYKAFSK